MSNTFVPTTFFSEEKSDVYPVSIGGSTLFAYNKYLTFSPSSSGNRKTWTLSVWIKKGYQDSISYPTLLHVSSSQGKDDIVIHDGEVTNTYKIERRFYEDSTSTLYELRTTAVFKDYASWYHIVYVRDTTQSTASDRERFYVNGELVTSFEASDYLDQDYEAIFNTNYSHRMCAGLSLTTEYLASYLADVYFIDGQALTPDNFATSKNGIWVPIEYQGSYGTNGYHLSFRDPSDIGNDSSGNDNDWSPTGLTSSDVYRDSPTNNYPVLNPLVNNDYSPDTISEGNLTATTDTSSDMHIQHATIAFPKEGKWYVEGKFAGGSGGTRMSIGIADSQNIAKHSSNNLIVYQDDGNLLSGGGLSSYGASWSSGDYIGVVYDVDNKDITFYKNGVSQGVANSNVSFSESVFVITETGGNYKWEINFGQKSWAYAPPSGYKSLCSENIPTDNQPVKQEAQLVTGSNYTFFDHEIQRSCFGNGGVSNTFRLSRTPTTTGNRKKWTYSTWIRQVDYGNSDKCCAFSTGINSNNNSLFHLSNTWSWYVHEETGGTKAFRVEPIIGVVSPWEWHHVVLQVDTTQSTAKNRIVLWIDGIKYNELYSIIDEQPTQNLDTRVNNTGEPFYLFYNVNNNTYSYMYLADVYFLDGSAEPATTFGEFKNGYWKPKNPGTLSYGTNGFHLNFADTSNPGKDVSGKGNDLTASNFLSNYITKDSPTNKLAVIDYYASDSAYITEGGISFDRSYDNRGWSSTMLVDSGKWYCEITLDNVGDALVGVGSINYEWNTELGLKDGEIGWYQPDGTLRINNTTGNLYGYSFNDGDVIGIALDMNNNRVYFSLNGVWQRGGTPETIGLPAAVGLPSPCQIIVSTHGTSRVKGTINYGQYDFKHPPPSLFLPLGDYYDYNVSSSIRTSGSSDEGYLSRTFSSTGNRKTWTFSTWFKDDGPGSAATLFGTPITPTTSGTSISLRSTFGALAFTFIESSTTKYLYTVPEFRDAKWHHLVVVVDTTQSTSSDRVRLYVDSKRITDFTTENYPSQNADLDVNVTNLVHNIGSASTKTGIQLAETIFVDGHAIDPVFFGTYKDNMWVPIDYDTNYGVYGDNGFYLNYSNSSARGEDSSGNDNDFTVTAGSVVGLTDSPTTHFCVLNKEAYYKNGSANKDMGTTNHNGLSWTNASSTSFNGCYGTHGMWAGKYYWEVFTKDGDATNKGNWMAGIANTSNTQHVIKRSDGTIASFAEGSSTATWSSHGSAIGNSDTLCVAYDADNGKVWFGKNGTWFNSGNPVAGTNPAFTLSAGGRPFVGDLGNGTSYVGINFGQSSFNYTPPTGFVGVSYKNMTRPSNYDDYEGTTPYCLDGGKSGNDVIIYNDSKSITTVSGSSWTTILTNQPIPAHNDYTYTDGLSYYYWEAVLTSSGTVVVGVADSSINVNNFVGYDSHGWGFNSSDGKIYHDNSSSTYGNSCTTNDVIGIAVGVDSSNNVAKLFFSKNGVWQNSGTPAYTSLSGTLYPAFSVYDDSSKIEVNFGNTPFKSEMPTAKPLACIKSTDNRDFHPFSAAYLPASTAGYDYGFDLSLYTGNSTGEAKNIIDANFKADLLWIKNRTAGDSNVLLDNVRGWNREFRPDVDYEENVTEFHEALEQEGVQTVVTNRIVISKQTARYNTNNEKHVAWYWKVDSDWGVDIVSFIGDGTTPRQIAHNLGKVPEFWFVRNRERDYAYWYVYHKDLDASIPQNKYLRLNADSAVADASTLWADTAPTSTHFTVGNHNSVNRDGEEIMFYLFTGISGFSKFGYYVGNGSADGPFVYTGFRPAYILTKPLSAHDWRIFDVKRLGYNNKNYVLRTAASGAEASEDSIDILSNGFKITSNDNNSNRAATRIIYAAFAEQPIKYANAR